MLIEKEQYPLNIDITYKKNFPLSSTLEDRIKVYMYPLDGTISLSEKCIMTMKTKGGVLGMRWV